MKTILSLFILLLSASLYSQDDDENDSLAFNKWETNYTMTNITDVIKSEKTYAEKIEHQKKESQLYCRIDKFKFEAKYLGQSRPIQSNELDAFCFVYKLFVGDPKDFRTSIGNMYEFEVNGQKIWFPIQKVLEDDFEAEITKGDIIKLYCFYANYHNEKKELYNFFLISEFLKM